MRRTQRKGKFFPVKRIKVLQNPKSVLAGKHAKNEPQKSAESAKKNFFLALSALFCGPKIYRYGL